MLGDCRTGQRCVCSVRVCVLAGAGTIHRVSDPLGLKDMSAVSVRTGAALDDNSLLLEMYIYLLIVMYAVQRYMLLGMLKVALRWFLQM